MVASQVQTGKAEVVKKTSKNYLTNNNLRMLCLPIVGGAYVSCISCNGHNTAGGCEWLKEIGHANCWHPVGTIFVLDEQRVR